MLSPTDMEKASLSKIIRDDTSFPLQFNTFNKDFKDLKTAISENVETNLDLLNEIPLPKNLDREELREFFRKKMKSNLEKDVLLEKSVELRKYTKNMYEFMDLYFREIFDYYEQRKKEQSIDMFCLSKMFLNSDLPMAFSGLVEDSILAEIDYIEIFTKRIKQERLGLLRNRNNQTKFQRVCDSHNVWIDRFNETPAQMEHDRVKLIWYVDFNNSASLNEIFKEKTIKMRLLDKETLFNFSNALQNQVHQMEKLNASMIEPYSFLPFKIDDGTKAIRKIMQLLTPEGLR